MGGKRRQCVICGRLERYRHGFFANFPSDETRCRTWIKVIGNEDLVHFPIELLRERRHVCSDHFETKDFNKKGNRLKKTAYPKLKLCAPPLTDEQMRDFPLHLKSTFLQKGPVQSTSLQIPSIPSIPTENVSLKVAVPVASTSLQIPSVSSVPTENVSLEVAVPVASTSLQIPSVSSVPTENVPSRPSNMELTPRKKKLLKTIEKKNITIKSLRKEIAKFKLKSPVLRNLIVAAVRNQNRKSHGKRWTKEDKSFALAVYKKSPKAYKYLNQLLPMPSVRTLQTILQNVSMDPGVYSSVMAHLKKRGETFSEENKICVLMFDEIALKKRLIYNIASDKVVGYVDIGGDEGRTQEVADHALVFMLQGIKKKFKQPIAHYFVKGTISTPTLVSIIKNVIRAVRAAGYTVISTVCDQGPTNVGALNMLKHFSGNPVEANFYVIDNEKIYIIYDVPHLFKSIRNNFLNGGEMMMDNKTAKWCHLKELERCNSSTLHFKTITKLHVEPKFRSKMKVKLAAQILSNTVAAILKLLSQNVAYQDKSKEILETAEVIEDLDKLFDCTNGPSSAKDIKKNIRENVKDNSFHHRLWVEYKRKLKSVTFQKSDSQLRLKNVRCINGYLITISSLQDIWNYVKSKNFKYLNLRQLNQDSLENLFGLIRQHSPTNKNPTCYHFESALKSSIITRLSSYVSRGSNCESDSSEILFDFHDIVFQQNVTAEVTRNDNVAPSTSTSLDIASANKDLPVLHIDEHDEEMESAEQLEELFKMFHKQPTVYVSGYLAKAILKDQKCSECRRTITELHPQPNSIYNYIALREWWSDKTSLTYPSIRLCETVDVATKVFERDVRNQLFRKDISLYCTTVMMTECNLTWVCGDHRDEMSKLLLRRLSNLLIRNECQLINQSFALTEESSADALKISQQQGMAK